MNWQIGQEIVCIRTHTKGKLKRGQIYTIQALRKSMCSCDEIEIDVGVPTGGGFGECLVCGYIAKNKVSAWWFSEKSFAPLEYNMSAIEELLEEPISV